VKSGGKRKKGEAAVRRRRRGKKKRGRENKDQNQFGREEERKGHYKKCWCIRALHLFPPFSVSYLPLARHCKVLPLVDLFFFLDCLWESEVRLLVPT
jgi:hypothetical protein